MTEPDPAVLVAVAQLARDLPHVDAGTAWARLAHLTPEQRAEVERVMVRAQGVDGLPVVGRPRPEDLLRQHGQLPRGR